VQRSTFGRRLQGRPDVLPGFEPVRIAIGDPGVVRATGRTHHANLAFTGREGSQVSGTAFEVADAELEAADEYERQAGYVRITVTLASGAPAWVYVHAQSGPRVS
jgi:hypothetical protein